MKFFRNIFALCFFAVNASSCSHYYSSDNKSEGHWGRLKSFTQLSKFHSVDDYRISINYQKSQPLVMAIHGGQVEAGTAELARAINDDLQISSYIFEGLLAPDFFTDTIQSGHMHITSHKFDDPNLLELAEDSSFCLSLHGFPSKKTDICLGGLASKHAKKLLKTKLKSKFPKLRICVNCCPPYLGRHPENVVNKCINKGIQVEMNPKVRSKILDNTTFKNELSSLLRSFLGASKW